jgi:hypothetical protein
VDGRFIRTDAMRKITWEKSSMTKARFGMTSPPGGRCVYGLAFGSLFGCGPCSLNHGTWIGEMGLALIRVANIENYRRVNLEDQVLNE